MNICIDAHAIGAKLTGNETYIFNLIKHLAEIDQVNQYSLLYTHETAIERLSWLPSNFTLQKLWPKQSILRLPISTPLLAAGSDLLHVQYTAPPLCPVPVVASIHDISFEHYPEWFSPREVFQFRRTIRHTALNCRKIITISEYSKRDIASTYAIDPEKITVTYCGVSQNFRPDMPLDFVQKTLVSLEVLGPYFLVVGNLQPRKNLARLITAYSQLSAENGELPSLVIVGKKSWQHEATFGDIDKAGLSNKVIFTGYVHDDVLPALYRGAIAFLYPSLFEGFGLPALEAMACGTPVLCGNTSSLPEVVGDAALKVDPYSVGEIYVGLKQLTENQDLRNLLAVHGIKQASKFSWTRMAQSTLDVYKQVPNS